VEYVLVAAMVVALFLVPLPGGDSVSEMLLGAVNAFVKRVLAPVGLPIP
jgi:hypothetical protein